MKEPKLKEEDLGRIYCLEGPLEGLERRIRDQFAPRLKIGQITNLYVFEEQDYDDTHFNLQGMRPYTEKELEVEKQAALRKKEKELKEAAETRERELTWLAKLKAKYEGKA